MGRRPVAFLIVALAMAALWGRPAVAKASDRALAVFASERILGRWVGSSFGTTSAGGASPNDCENEIAQGLSAGGFLVPFEPLSDQQRLEARKFRVVFGRYGDVSTMPNDTAVRAAGIVGGGARAVVACGVKAAVRKPRQRSAGAICANAECKAVDMAARRRVATAAGERCAERSQGAAGAVAAVRSVCREMGETLARDLSGRY